MSNGPAGVPKGKLASKGQNKVIFTQWISERAKSHIVSSSSLVSPGLNDHGSGHIWMQFPLKLMQKTPSEMLEAAGKQGYFNITKMKGG